MLKIQERIKKNLNTDSNKEQLLNRDQRLLQSEGMHVATKIKKKTGFERECPRKKESPKVLHSTRKS